MSEQQRPDASPRSDSSDPTERPDERIAPREIPSDQIFGGNQEVLIRHAGELYRLRLTRNGKLILHK